MNVMGKIKKKLVPLSLLLENDCLGDFARYADDIYIDVAGIASHRGAEHLTDKIKHT